MRRCENCDAIDDLVECPCGCGKTVCSRCATWVRRNIWTLRRFRL